MQNQAPGLESRLNGSAKSIFLQELFGNSLHFPIANTLLELLLEGGLPYLLRPDLYILLAAGATQAFFLSRWQMTAKPRRLAGNLIAPALYTLVETLLEGGEFFSSPNHWAYWGFSLFFGILQQVRPHLPRRASDVTQVLEEVGRSSILAVMYYFFEVKTNPAQTVTFAAFLQDSSHLYVILIALLLGLNSGLANLNAQRYLVLLRETSELLRRYSEWLFGKTLLGKAVQNPSALQLQRQERTILFMDIRGFTRWSEERPPEEVVRLLNRYYQIAESALEEQNAIKYKFSGDEVMAIFETIDQAVQAALRLRAQIGSLLGRQRLGAGIGLHNGAVVEGVLGGKQVRIYDVLGDTVNTAKRIESAAGAGELLVSEAIRLRLGTTFLAGPKRQVTVKGKEQPVIIYPLE